jgi:predicted transcriptional regulator
MAKSKLKPRKNVVSFRISDEERMSLDAIVENKNKSVSEIMHEALENYTNRKQMTVTHNR